MRQGIAAFAALMLAGCNAMPIQEAQGPRDGNVNSPTFASQIHGGAFTLDPQLTRYVTQVGQGVADQVQVFNTSAIEAWSLPDGNLAVSRGLLLNVACEADLTIALADTMARAPRESAVEEATGAHDGAVVPPARGIMHDSTGPPVVGAAKSVARWLAYQRAVDADRVTRWSAKEEASATARALPSSARSRGCSRYQSATARLRALRPAYEAYDAASQALDRHDLAAARERAQFAISLLPQEARFHELLGDIALEQRHRLEALTHYQHAIDRDSDYYRPYLQAGSLLYQLGDDHRASQLLERSMTLLPTASAAFDLARVAHDAGDPEQEVRYYQLAASSDSPVGRSAARALVQIDIARHPARYVDVEPRVDPSGHVWMEVRNRAPIPIDSVVVAAAIAGMGGGVAEGPVRLSTGREPLAPEGIAQLPTSLGPLSNPKAIRLVQAEVAAAEAAR
jgi:beta-barrel assembly-enhancing protease